MKDVLAEKLLATVMDWEPRVIAREMPDLQAIALAKYDEYQQFSPGMRFIESLALWLNQFRPDEREIAYRFFKKHLIYISTAEINHLVSMAYTHGLRPILVRKVAEEIGLDKRHIVKLVNTKEFRVRRRRCLFLALSDGARIDYFRRVNGNELSHEQILPTYEIADDRGNELLEKLKKDLEEILGRSPKQEEACFQTVVLLDDFSGTGYSYFRKEDGTFKGKIGKFLVQLSASSSVYSRLVSKSGVGLYVVLYVATERVKLNLETDLAEACRERGIKAQPKVIILHLLTDSCTILPSTGVPVESLVEAYYDHADETEHTRRSGKDLKYGFGWCGLPLVLSHNTPNNSIYLLWAEKSDVIRPLFPRVSRHR